MQKSILTDVVAPTEAQQMFVIGSGIAGGLAGWFLAKGLAGVKEVPMSLVLGATLVSVLCTVGSGIYLARKVKES